MGRWYGGFVDSSPLTGWDIPCGVHKTTPILR